MGGPGRANTGNLLAVEPIRSRWGAQDPEDRHYIYRDQNNRMLYEKYGGSNYNYDSYRGYYTTYWPPINPPPIAHRKMEILPPSPNQPFRKPPGFENGNVERGERPTIDLNELVSRNGSQRRRKSEATTNKDEGRAPNRRE